MKNYDYRLHAYENHMAQEVYECLRNSEHTITALLAKYPEADHSKIKAFFYAEATQKLIPRLIIRPAVITEGRDTLAQWNAQVAKEGVYGTNVYDMCMEGLEALIDLYVATTKETTK